jgi:hypothetical protein
MPRTRSTWGVLAGLAISLIATGARAGLDRPPEILELRQAGNTVRLLWAPGGNADGTLNEEVVAYEVQREGLGVSTWATVFSGDEHAMTYVDSIDAPRTWHRDKGKPVHYRVESHTTSDRTLSAVASLVPSLPLWGDEALDGKAWLAWIASRPRITGATHLGYKVQKYVQGSWVDLTGYLSGLSYVDPGTTTGVSRYRVKSVYRKPAGGTDTYLSNKLTIDIRAACEGQVTDPAIPPLTVIEIGDRDSDLDYDGDDIADALQECAEVQYEDLSGPGDDDGIYEAGNGERLVTGGCILRALPVTYDDVAIMITDSLVWCDELETPQHDPTDPIHCLELDFPAGLVIEGEGHETVFRSPLREAPYQPTPLLELHRKDFQLTLRNLVLDGRKHEQVDPAFLTWAAWPHFGFRTWAHAVAEIEGDGLGDDDGACEVEVCTEKVGGNHDGDGRCEAGEECHGPGGPEDSCENDSWTNTAGCTNQVSADDGCVHNVEVRNFLHTGMRFADAKRWIIEDSEFHDMGCVNRGYGFDCPYLESAPDVGGGGPGIIPGSKVPGFGAYIEGFTSDFQVRRNEIYRTTKYALGFKNGDAASNCSSLVENHDAFDNYIHDVGGTGIFNHGSRGARIHHNEIDGTTVWNEPPSMNGVFNTTGIDLGGFCSDDNEYYDNTISRTAGFAFKFDAVAESVDCVNGVCTPNPLVGNTIRDNTISDSCAEKDAAPGSNYGYGAIHTGNIATGILNLVDNTLTANDCRSPISVYQNLNAKVDALDVRVSGGIYESGNNGATNAQDWPGCGAVQVQGTNRKLVMSDETRIPNVDLEIRNEIPKACVLNGGTLVIDDTGGDELLPGNWST